jgi:hypothetical protein
MKCCPFFVHLFMIWIKFGAGDVHKDLSGKQRIEIYRLLMGVNEQLLLLHSVSDLSEIRRKRSGLIAVERCDFCGNVCREGRTVRMDVNIVTFTRLL